MESENVSEGAVAWPRCPNCGESIAEPVTLYSTEWQGDEMHGGLVRTEEQACALCVKESKLRDCEMFSEAEIASIMDEYRKELIGRSA
jgi:hypothetical protein